MLMSMKTCTRLHINVEAMVNFLPQKTEIPELA